MQPYRNFHPKRQAVMATFRSTPTIPPEVITYRLADKLVYVRPADDYEACRNP